MNLLPPLTDGEYDLLRDCLYKLESDGEWFHLSSPQLFNKLIRNLIVNTVTDARNDTEWCGYSVSKDYKTISLYRPESWEILFCKK